MQNEANSARKAFQKLARSAAELEQHLDSDGYFLLAATVARQEAYLNDDTHRTSYIFLKQAMIDVEGLSLTGEAAKQAWVFLLAYAEMLDIIEARIDRDGWRTDKSRDDRD